MLRIGIVGCAHIARQFTRAVQPSAAARIVAVASRREEVAQAFAAECGIPRHHGSYEALLADPDVSVVYIPLPNSMHAEWAIRAAQAGKHVLCEKPLALTAAQARAMFDAARAAGVMLLEAYPYWFQPQTRDLLALLHGDTLGEVRSVQASFGFTLRDADTNIRMKPDLGGGALLDAGSYPVSLIRLAMGCAPERVRADATWSGSGPHDGVDIATLATLFYADGRRAQMSCAMNTATHRHATLVLDQGVIETEYLNHTAAAPADPQGPLPSQMRVRRGVGNTVPFETVVSATGSGFRFCVEAFADVIARQDHAAIARAAQASVDIAATLEAVARSARSGREEAVRVQRLG